MADQTPYNYDDIKKYLQQQMTRQEMHAFEKAMMEDPFLADALEGFQNSDLDLAGEQRLQLKNEIQGQQKAKLVPMATRANRWWRIAALLIVLVGAGIFSYNVFTEKPSTQEIALSTPAENMNRDTLSPAEEPIAATGAAPLDEVEAERKSSGSPLIRQDSPALFGEKKREEAAPGLLAMKTAEKKELADSNSAVARSLKSINKYNMQAVAKSQTAADDCTGKITDRQGNPVPLAKVITEENIGASVNKEGVFSVNGSDSLLTVNVMAPGFEKETATIKRGKNSKIMLREDVEQRKKIRSKSATELPDTEAAPEKGWPHFNRFIDSAIAARKQAMSNWPVARVELHFDIDENGRPVNIRAANNSPGQVEALAIELLKNGPLWKRNATHTKGNVVIKFE